MAENTTLARPYARAAFEAAQKDPDGLKRWSDMLAFVASVAADPGVQSLLGSPEHDTNFKAGLFLDVAGDRLNQEGSNFVKLLAENRRLAILPEIHEVFEELRADAEKTVEAEVISAYKVNAAQQKKIAEALSKRLNREVVLNCRVDKSLIGGAVIRAGDLVIDGSARGKLAQLAHVLSR